jgi:phage-related protein
MTRLSRPVNWIRAALKDFMIFPVAARERLMDAIAIAAEGSKSDIAKPLKGLGAGAFEIALAHRVNAFRVVYVVQLGDAVWVVHAFQKKSVKGIKTPRHEIELASERIKAIRLTVMGN